MVEGFADVLGDEVAGKVGVESFAYTGDGLGCADKGLIVTVVGDHDAVGCRFRIYALNYIQFQS